ncbi:hypothetical protein ABT373_14955 [Streptomyces sp. NPDC000070]|uniref:hypothetical protein n=1 Tax=Streptomyces sp. NPDC000070 TaxID=3154240 RepID=UPI00331E4970
MAGTVIGGPRKGFPAACRSRDVLIVLAFGVLVAPTAFGQCMLEVVGELAAGITQAGR